MEMINQKKISQTMRKKEERACYWRNQEQCSNAMACVREEFSKRVNVYSLTSTISVESYSAIIDSRRGIVVK